MIEQRNRTEQVILDTSKREAELLLRNNELTHEVKAADASVFIAFEPV